jgi:radical SAM protein with 4Fe4S-binding SPASM domain
MSQPFDNLETLIDMILSKNLQIYLKTSDTCNLNCSHCFTSGSRGAKNFFDPLLTSDFIVELTNQFQTNSTRILYHGGEPMLAPLKDMYLFYEKTKDKVPNVEYGIQTNLVYNLSDNKFNFLKEVIGLQGLGTSWDALGRFGSNRPNSALIELELWEKNVRTLAERGFEMTLMVSLSKYILQNYRPADILLYAIDLGFKYILFERITADGNAATNSSFLPNNRDIDQWILQMYLETKEYGFHKKIGNMFLEEIALSVVKGIHSANRCRGCEQKLITINADGTLSGCPNSAPHDIWGNIRDGVRPFLSSPKRTTAICKEMVRNKVCLTCDVSHLCNGDCYKLKWQDEVCAAPKSLMRYLNNQNEFNFCKELFI